MAVPQALLKVGDDLRGTQWAPRDLALNRSVVVLTVAAWQAWVETYVKSALTAMAATHKDRLPDSPDEQLRQAASPLINLALQEVARFNTPDAGGVCRLIGLLGDDPRPRWSFNGVGGQRSPGDVSGRLDDWLRVRHAIAHGARHLPTVQVLGRTKAGHGSLTHRRASQCATFFRDLALATGHEQ